ncbi:MAG: hypothetical protein M1838_002173 [Thelocarpon superellum]|nr:MAG: hypothetical protein M1838_002173 [Thelocarpon superellum]
MYTEAKAIEEEEDQFKDDYHPAACVLPMTMAMAAAQPKGKTCAGGLVTRGPMRIQKDGTTAQTQARQAAQLCQSQLSVAYWLEENPHPGQEGEGPMGEGQVEDMDKGEDLINTLRPKVVEGGVKGEDFEGPLPKKKIIKGKVKELVAPC